eukprot:8666060-Pyramimonas_sp.AAC.1
MGVPRRCPHRVSSRLAKALYRCVAWLRDSGPPNMWCGGGSGGGSATAAETTSRSRLFRRKATVSKWLSAAMSNELRTASRMRVQSSLAGCAVISGAMIHNGWCNCTIVVCTGSVRVYSFAMWGRKSMPISTQGCDDSERTLR